MPFSRPSHFLSLSVHPLQTSTAGTSYGGNILRPLLKQTPCPVYLNFGPQHLSARVSKLEGRLRDMLGTDSKVRAK